MADFWSLIITGFFTGLGSFLGSYFGGKLTQHTIEKMIKENKNG